jgi:hypothetical protein
VPAVGEVVPLAPGLKIRRRDREVAQLTSEDVMGVRRPAYWSKGGKALYFLFLPLMLQFWTPLVKKKKYQGQLLLHS